jgi:hypothetical protein
LINSITDEKIQLAEILQRLRAVLSNPLIDLEKKIIAVLIKPNGNAYFSS